MSSLATVSNLLASRRQWAEELDAHWRVFYACAAAALAWAATVGSMVFPLVVISLASLLVAGSGAWELGQSVLGE